jgi:hypothetical protein
MTRWFKIGSRVVVAPVAILLVLLLAGGGLAGCATDDRAITVVVRHGPAPDPTVVDLGAPGPSAGDQRIWHFPGTTGGRDVMTNWVMTTIAVDAPEKGVETRVTAAVFTFGDSGTLLLEGVGLYPGAGAVLKLSTTLERAVIGGTGIYAGATGSVVSEHLADNSWVHTFTVDVGD